MSDLYYDPWDVAIDLDPYPTYRRLRDEAPLYYNERHDFWGISRYDDVDTALRDTARLSSAKGDILEVVMADPVMPPGVFINEDPPLHTIHRAIVSRAFTPKRIRAIEAKVRSFCVACLDPLLDGDRSTSSSTSALNCPCAQSGCSSVSGTPTSRPSVPTPTTRCVTNQVSHCRWTRTTTSTATCSPSTSAGGRTTRPTT